VAAPEYVPQPPLRNVRSYESPPRRNDSWVADRPGDLETAGQPRGERLGSQGPDQGYIYVLARRFQGKLQLASDESEADALAGCIGVALKRASLFGRAPVLHDLTVALTIWGFLGEAAPDLIAFRQPLFEEVANPHHYAEQRHVVDLVPEEALRRSPQELAEAHRDDWRSLLDIS
jgi:hypothetical protein